MWGCNAGDLVAGAFSPGSPKLPDKPRLSASPVFHIDEPGYTQLTLNKNITGRGRARAAQPMSVNVNKKKRNRTFWHIPALVLFLALPARAELLRLEASANAMGATYSVVLYDQDRNKMESAAEDAFSEARRLDALLSNYRPESELSKVNREAATHPVAVSQELFDLFAACAGYSRESEGAFDITVGPLS